MKGLRVSFLVLSISICAVSLLGMPRFSNAADTSLQTQIDANNQAIAQLNQQIAKYEAAIQQADADKETLQNAINKLELQKKAVQAQINATQSQISTTQLQIQQLGSSIADTQDAIDANHAALATDLRSLQQADTQSLVAQMLSSNSLSDAWNDADAIGQVNTAIQDKIDTLANQKQALAASQTASQQKKAALTEQKATLSSQQTTLTQTTKQKTQLLAETNASEAQYQKLLAQAKAQLASFSTFAQNAGGSGLLSNQTSCDSWGCYYNQRDSSWGNQSLNGTKYQLKSDGCLVTSMAMVMTHYGYRDVTPVSINSDPSNFAAYFPAYLLMTIHVDGMSVTRKSSYINATLAGGDPVIIGLNAYGGTHFVVLTKRVGNDYLMRDPYIPNAKDVSFSAHYSLRQIFGVSKVLITS